jgi:hypothetical protein
MDEKIEECLSANALGFGIEKACLQQATNGSMHFRGAYTQGLPQLGVLERAITQC